MAPEVLRLPGHGMTHPSQEKVKATKRHDEIVCDYLASALLLQRPHALTHTNRQERMYAYFNTNTYIHTHAQLHKINRYTHNYVISLLLKHRLSRTHTRTHKHTHTYTHTYTNTHTHTRAHTPHTYTFNITMHINLYIY